MILLENSSSTKTTRNTGKGKQDLFEETINYALTKDNFGFNSVEEAKSKSAWDTAKKNKDLVVMFSVEGSELSNSEATYYESRTMKIETKQARKGLKVKHHLDMHSHAALKSFSNSGYTRVIEFTRDGKIKTEYQNGKIVGQKLNEFIVGMMQEPVIGGDPMTTIAELVYKDYNSFEHNAHVLIPDFDLGIYEGIYDVRFNIIESDPANIKMSAYTLDGNAVDNLQISDFVMKNTTGDRQIIDAMSFSEEEQAYILTGAFMSGTIETNGVIVQSNIMYEGARIDLNL